MTLLQGNQIGLFGDSEPVANKLERVKNDYYPTPEAITKTLIDVCFQNEKGTYAFFEPCAGNSAISDVLIKENIPYALDESDIAWDSLGCQPKDATQEEFWDYWYRSVRVSQLNGSYFFDWVITNPPFSAATEILSHSWEYCNIGCAFLLRLSFLEPTGGRADLLKSMSDHLRYVIPVSPRPKFRRDVSGSDSVTCAWFVWDKRWSWSGKGMQSPFQFVSGWRQS